MDYVCEYCPQDYCNDYKKFIDPSDIKDTEEEGKASNSTDPDSNAKAKVPREGEEGSTTDAADEPSDEPDNKQNGATVVHGGIMVATIIVVTIYNALNFYGPIDGRIKGIITL